MADFSSVIARAVAGLEKNTGDTRRVLYERARAALVEHVRVTIPALPPSEVARQRAALEAAIRKVESDSLRQIDPLVELARLIGATHLIAPPSITSSQSNPPRAELGALNSLKKH